MVKALTRSQSDPQPTHSVRAYMHKTSSTGSALWTAGLHAHSHKINVKISQTNDYFRIYRFWNTRNWGNFIFEAGFYSNMKRNYHLLSTSFKYSLQILTGDSNSCPPILELHAARETQGVLKTVSLFLAYYSTRFLRVSSERHQAVSGPWVVGSFPTANLSSTTFVTLSKVKNVNFVWQSSTIPTS